MLHKSDSSLQAESPAADLAPMPSHRRKRNRQPGHSRGDRSGTALLQSTAVEVGLSHLAHELNSLLDGSLRCINLVQRALAGWPQTQTEPAEHVNARLKIGQEGLCRMAQLLKGAMESPHAPLGLPRQGQTLDAEVRQVLRIL